MSKSFSFGPSAGMPEIIGVTEGPFCWRARGAPPWECDAETWLALKRAAPGMFIRVAAPAKEPEATTTALPEAGVAPPKPARSRKGRKTRRAK